MCDIQYMNFRVRQARALLVNAGNRDDVDSITRAGRVPRAISALIASSDRDDLARGSNATSDYRARAFGPAVRTTQGQGEDVLAVLNPTQQSFYDDCEPR